MPQSHDSTAPFAVRKQCDECPWRTDVPPGKFPPERFRKLAGTARPGTWPATVFACHLTPDDKPRACAGFLAVVGFDNNQVRVALSKGWYDPADLELVGPVFPDYRSMAEANGVDPSDPALDGLPE